MSDSGDISSEFEIADIDRAIKAHLQRQAEHPTLNGNSEKICLECGEVIDQPRAGIIGVVRCLPCQRGVELGGKRYA